MEIFAEDTKSLANLVNTKMSEDSPDLSITTFLDHALNKAFTELIVVENGEKKLQPCAFETCKKIYAAIIAINKLGGNGCGTDLLKFGLFLYHHNIDIENPPIAIKSNTPNSIAFLNLIIDKKIQAFAKIKGLEINPNYKVPDIKVPYDFERISAMYKRMMIVEDEQVQNLQVDKRNTNTDTHNIYNLAA